MAEATNEHERRDATDPMRATNPPQEAQTGRGDEREVENYRDEYDVASRDQAAGLTYERHGGADGLAAAVHGSYS
jgi:hypothetical protein